VPPLDLGPEARPEAGLDRQLDAVLRRERARKIRPRDEPELDDRLAEALSRRLLSCERTFELVVGQETLFDEDSSEWTPSDVGRFHALYIGAVAVGDKGFGADASEGLGLTCASPPLCGGAEVAGEHEFVGT
jgi:hypothetical protein